MIRDTIKNSEYWNKYLDTQDKRIVRFIDAFNESSLGTGVNNEHANRILRHLFHLQREKVYAMYSAGSEITEIIDQYTKMVDSAKKLEILSYNEFQLILSLSVLFKYDIISNNLYKVLKRKTDEGFRNAFSDATFSCDFDLWLSVISSYILKNTPLVIEKRRILFPETKAFGAVITKMFVASEDEKVALINNYMKLWYKLNKDSSWYDAHKRNDNIYVGYWAFECGALAKIFSLPASSFHDIKYFPIDLLN